VSFSVLGINHLDDLLAMVLAVARSTHLDVVSVSVVASAERDIARICLTGFLPVIIQHRSSELVSVG
jgi:hypothetical protein